MEEQKKQKKQQPEPTHQAVIEAIKALDYGTVTVTIHDGKPVLLEVSKKIKF